MDLSDAEMGMIMTTWQIPMGNPEESGKVILSTFFQKNPVHLKYFDTFQGKELSEIAVDPKFKIHAGRVVRTFDNLVKSAVDKGVDGALVKETWIRLANSHSKRNIAKEAFSDLKNVMSAVLTEVCQLDEMQQNAWNKLLNYVFGIMIEKLASQE